MSVAEEGLRDRRPDVPPRVVGPHAAPEIIIDLREGSPVFDTGDVTRLPWYQARWQRAIKRAIDITLAVLLILVTAPIVLFSCLAIMIESPGNPFYRQDRCGLVGRNFRILKLRTMIPKADRMLSEVQREAMRQGWSTVDAPAFKSAQDPRITKVGRILRRLCIDELPQVLNILSGDMSFVGPRPLVWPEADALGQNFFLRHAMRPGVTCTWQVSDRSQVSWEQRIAMDIEYIESWSLWLDLKLLAKTVPAVLSGRGAY